MKAYLICPQDFDIDLSDKYFNTIDNSDEIVVLFSLKDVETFIEERSSKWLDTNCPKNYGIYEFNYNKCIGVMKEIKPISKFRFETLEEK